MSFEKIKALLKPGNYIDNTKEMEPYLHGWRGGHSGKAGLVAFPKTTEEVAAIVKLCAEHGIPITPQGGNTGLVGGSVPDQTGKGIVLSLTRMNKVRQLDRTNFAITVEAGLILSQLQEEAAKAGFLFPLSMASEGSADVGGFVSTNAGGTAVLRYGNTRDLVLGLEAVLPDGTIWNGLKALRKDNTGYDLKQLFIGGEGTLGVVTAATLKLFPEPKQNETLLLALSSPADAVTLFSELRRESGDALTAFEIISRPALELVLKHIEGTRDPFPALHPYYLLLVFSTSSELVPLREVTEKLLEKKLEQGLIVDALLAESVAQAKRFWHMREHISEAAKKEGRGVHFDISVPISAIGEFLRTTSPLIQSAVPEAIILPFGHIGDGNIHYNICLPKATDDTTFSRQKEDMKAIVYDVLKQFHGSISAEHGIGVERRADLSLFKSKGEIEVMKALKKAIDPKGIMNPGKML